MENKKTVSRKKFLSWGLVFSSILAVPSALFLGKKNSTAEKNNTAEKTTAKLLTQDGKLVEIDIKNLPSSQVKIKDGDIHHWIRNKKKL